MTHVSPDTDQLLRLAKSGDLAATDALFAQHRSRLRTMVRLRMDRGLLSRLDPSDVVQEVFLEASTKLDEFLDQPPLPFYPWLRQMAWQRLVKLHERHLKAQKRSVQKEVRWDGLPNDSITLLADRWTDSGQTPSRMAVRRELLDRVRQALLEIGEQDREILVMRFLEQLTVAEVAAILDISVSAVKTRQFRALARVRDRLTDEGANHA